MPNLRVVDLDHYSQDFRIMAVEVIAITFEVNINFIGDSSIFELNLLSCL